MKLLRLYLGIPSGLGAILLWPAFGTFIAFMYAEHSNGGLPVVDLLLPKAADDLVAGAMKYLAPIPGVLHFHVGKMAGLIPIGMALAVTEVFSPAQSLIHGNGHSPPPGPLVWLCLLALSSAFSSANISRHVRQAILSTVGWIRLSDG